MQKVKYYIAKIHFPSREIFKDKILKTIHFYDLISY